MIRRRLAAALGGLVLALPSLTAQEIKEREIRAHLEFLSSDLLEGRAPATRGGALTEAYLAAQMRYLGLEPAVNGSYLQRVPIDVVAADRASIRAVASGKATATLRDPDDVVLWAGASVERSAAKAEVVFVGYGVTAPEFRWDDFKDVDVRGKVVVVLVNDPDFEGGEGNFEGPAMTYYGRWTYKYEEAARRGAAGLLIVHETEPASYGWATVKNSNTNTMFDIVRQNPAAAHAPVEGWIQRDTAAQLFKSAGLDFEAAKQAAKRRDFRPIDLKSTMTAHFGAKTETITSYNVVGYVPGTRYPDETVIYTAHHDHLGIGKPDANGDAIFNGATDNATGVAHLIEQARAFARGPRPERSVVFLAVAAEEKGLLGSEYYAANPLFPLAKTVGVLNTDSMGTFGPARDYSMSGNARLELLDILIEEGKRQGRRFTPEQNPGAGLFFRSDHFPFAQEGVPAISFKPGLDLVNGGTARGKALAEEYVAKRYHQPDDEYSADWLMSGIVQDAQLLHLVGQRLANSRVWPNWSPESEFRGTRDKSASERGATAVPPPTQPSTTPSPPAKGERG